MPKDDEDDDLQARRERSLVARPTGGAMVSQVYLHRTEDYVAVTRDELQDIRAEGIANSLALGTGMFMLSGSLWVVMDKLVSTPESEPYPALMWTMLTATAFGAILLLIGALLSRRRSEKIANILKNARPARIVG